MLSEGIRIFFDLFLCYDFASFPASALFLTQDFNTTSTQLRINLTYLSASDNRLNIVFAFGGLTIVVIFIINRLFLGLGVLQMVLEFISKVSCHGPRVASAEADS